MPPFIPAPPNKRLHNLRPTSSSSANRFISSTPSSSSPPPRPPPLLASLSLSNGPSSSSLLVTNSPPSATKDFPARRSSVSEQMPSNSSSSSRPTITTTTATTATTTTATQAQEPPWLTKFLSDRKHRDAVLDELSYREGTRATYRTTNIPSASPSSSNSHSTYANAQSYVPPSEQKLLETYSTRVASNPANRSLNRYADVLPYDRYCVYVNTDAGAGAGSGNGYLNASWVEESTGRQTWIASQAPLPSSIPSFFALASSLTPTPNRARTVVQLTAIHEGGMRKAHEYLPRTSGREGAVYYDLAPSSSSSSSLSSHHHSNSNASGRTKSASVSTRGPSVDFQPSSSASASANKAVEKTKTTLEVVLTRRRNHPEAGAVVSSLEISVLRQRFVISGSGSSSGSSRYPVASDINANANGSSYSTGISGSSSSYTNAIRNTSPSETEGTWTIIERDEPHSVTHVYYAAWPDYGVPAEPDTILELARLVEAVNGDVDAKSSARARSRSRSRSKSRGLGLAVDVDVGGRAELPSSSNPPPILVHCSAGVGRTGTFITISSLLRRFGFLGSSSSSSSTLPRSPTSPRSPTLPLSNPTSSASANASANANGTLEAGEPAMGRRKSWALRMSDAFSSGSKAPNGIRDSSLTSAASSLSPYQASPISSPLGPLPTRYADDLVVQEIDRLREFRCMMVQKPEQVVFVYGVLRSAFALLGGLGGGV